MLFNNKKILSVCLVAFLAGASTVFAQTGTWSGTISLNQAELTLVFNLTEGDEATMDIPDQGAKGVPAKVTRNGWGGIKIEIPSIYASYEGTFLGKAITGSFTQLGKPMELTLRPGLPKLNRPQTPTGPFPYKTEEVTFRNGDAILKGTLTLPEGCSSKTPVVLMVTGSGLQNRDEELFEHKPFAVIADALARAGIASLRYDDRGFGESTGDAANATVEDFKADAEAGIALLRGRFTKVGVLGHSEGGAIALLLAGEKKVDFAVCIAAMVVSGAETLLWQNRNGLEKAGIAPADIDSYCRLLEECFAAMGEGRPLPSAQDYALPDALAQNFAMASVQLQSPYFKSFVQLDPRKVLGSILCPVLAFNGTLDIQVSCESNLGALKAGLPSCVTVSVPDANHLLQHCKTGEVIEYKRIEETIAPEVLSRMTEWINSYTSD